MRAGQPGRAGEGRPSRCAWAKQGIEPFGSGPPPDLLPERLRQCSSPDPLRARERRAFGVAGARGARSLVRPGKSAAAAARGTCLPDICCWFVRERTPELWGARAATRPWIWSVAPRLADPPGRNPCGCARQLTAATHQSDSPSTSLHSSNSKSITECECTFPLRSTPSSTAGRSGLGRPWKTGETVWRDRPDEVR